MTTLNGIQTSNNGNITAKHTNNPTTNKGKRQIKKIGIKSANIGDSKINPTITSALPKMKFF